NAGTRCSRRPAPRKTGVWSRRRFIRCLTACGRTRASTRSSSAFTSSSVRWPPQPSPPPASEMACQHADAFSSCEDIVLFAAKTGAGGWAAEPNGGRAQRDYWIRNLPLAGDRGEPPRSLEPPGLPDIRFLSPLDHPVFRGGG